MEKDNAYINGVKLVDYRYQHIPITPTLETIRVYNYKRPEYMVSILPSPEFIMSVIQATYIKLYEYYRETDDRVYLYVLDKILNDELPLYETLFWTFERAERKFPGYPSLETLDVLIVEINEAYNEQGYTRTYFGWINAANMYVRAKEGEIPLRPDTFEAASVLSHESYKNIIRSLENTRRSTGIAFPAWKQNPRYLGWKKEDLFEAIKSSGLMRDKAKINYKGKGHKESKVILWRDIGIDKPGHVVGLDLTPYMPYYYYDAIYRKLHNTGSFINWSYLCRKKLVDIHTLRHFAVKDFDLSYAQVKKMKIPELCATLTRISNERTQITEDIAKSVANDAIWQSQAIILQPGSPWVKPQSEYFMRVTDPLEQYKLLKDGCENAGTKDDLIQLTTRMGVRNILPDNLEPYTKDAICEYLLETYLPKAEKYESVAIDCQNPHIRKRNIINTAQIMGLGGILPQDLSELSKEDVCRIIMNYVNLLRESKDLTLAPLR